MYLMTSVRSPEKLSLDQTVEVVKLRGCVEAGLQLPGGREASSGGQLGALGLHTAPRVLHNVT